MKQKFHSGLKKRVRVRKSGAVMVQKTSKQHLLSNKSKRQKKSYPSGMHINYTKMKIVRRLLPGAVRLAGKIKEKVALDTEQKLV